MNLQSRWSLEVNLKCYKCKAKLILENKQHQTNNFLQCYLNFLVH